MNLLDKLMLKLGYERRSTAVQLREDNKRLNKDNQKLIAQVANLQEDVISLRHGLSYSTKELDKVERKLLSSEKSFDMAKQYQIAYQEWIGGKKK